MMFFWLKNDPNSVQKRDFLGGYWKLCKKPQNLPFFPVYAIVETPPNFEVFNKSIKLQKIVTWAYAESDW